MGEYQGGNTPLEMALRSLVNQSGRDAYSNIEKVKKHLRQENIPQRMILQVELVLTESSLLRFLEQMSNGLSSVELNSILISAHRTGLSDEVIRETVSALLYGMGVPQVLGEFHEPDLKVTFRNEGNLYVPPWAYSRTLKKIEEKISNRTEIDKADYSILEQFVQAGVPMAYRLQGQLLLGRTDMESVRKGVEYLEYAMARGDAEAAALLADYYVNNNGVKAHKLYTRPGALAMDERRMRNFRALQKKRKTRWGQLWILLGIFVIVELMLFLLTNSPITGSQMTARNIFTAVNVLNLIWLVVRYVRDPYRDLQLECIPMLISVFLYALTLI